MTTLNIDVFDATFSIKSPLATLKNIASHEKVISLKEKIVKNHKHLSAEKISLCTQPQGKSLENEERIENLELFSGKLFLKFLEPQISWKKGFLLEYAGPVFIYPLFFFCPLIYGNSSIVADDSSANHTIGLTVILALICHSFHYLKRLYESEFVHRFSNETMSLQKLIMKNCAYYWGFAALISYLINHPLYTGPTFGYAQLAVGFISFFISEIGNFSIHKLLRDLRSPGTKQRKIPYPNSNPLTYLYDFVSCPNYTYEVASWISFSLMTQCLPAVLFTTIGFIQMKIWADEKHRIYKEQFIKYPKNRKPIIPFLC